jgi:hypothetical protein
MLIRQLDTTNRRDVRQFIDFPFELYRDCPQWVPPLVGDMQLVLNRRKHPFYAHSAADFFLAEEAGRTLGRIAVLDNRHYNEYRGTKKAFFYYFDSVEDPAVSRALFQAASEWARGRGLAHIEGPWGFLEGDSIGLLVEGFEHRPALSIAYNYLYYDALVTDAGFQRLTDYYSGYLPGSYDLPQRFYDIAEKVKAQRGFRIKRFRSKKELRQWVPRIMEVYNKAFVENLEYYPVTPAEARVISERLLAATDHRLVRLVMKGEEIVGFLFPFYDISAAIQKTRGRLWPFGWIALLREFKRTRWVNFNGVGLIPGHRGVGANAVLYTEVARTVHEFGFEHADVVQVEEQNAKSQGDMKAIGVRWYKKHRVYQRALGG